jgi:hypothetical protein
MRRLVSLAVLLCKEECFARPSTALDANVLAKECRAGGQRLCVCVCCVVVSQLFVAGGREKAMAQKMVEGR